MASWTACLSRLSRANIQWGFTCCCLKTFFTYIPNRERSDLKIPPHIWEAAGNYVDSEVAYSILEAEQHHLQAVSWYAGRDQFAPQFQEATCQLPPVRWADVVSQAGYELSDVVCSQRWSFVVLLKGQTTNSCCSNTQVTRWGENVKARKLVLNIFTPRKYVFMHNK